MLPVVGATALQFDTTASHHVAHGGLPEPDLQSLVHRWGDGPWMASAWVAGGACSLAWGLLSAQVRVDLWTLTSLSVLATPQKKVAFPRLRS